MQKFNFNNPGGLLNLNPNDTGSLGINISPINEQKKLEDEQRKKEEQRLKLQNLADTFNMIGANQSGDTQRMAFHSNRLAQRKAEQEARQLKAQKEARMAQYKESNPGMAGMLNALEAGVPAALLSNKDSSPSQAKLYKLAQEQGYKGSLIDFIQLQKQSTNINLNQGNLGKLGQELAADDYKKKRESAADATSVLTSVDTLENLLDQGVNTGFAANLGLGFQRIGQSIIGENYKVGDVAGREAFVAETTKLILPLVKQLGVNPTDKDLDFVKTGAIELSKSEAGNRLMIASLRLSMNRRVDEQIFNQNFYAKPENQNATIYARDIAFDEHKINNPDLYTSASLQQAYDDLLSNQASNNSTIPTNVISPFGN